MQTSRTQVSVDAQSAWTAGEKVLVGAAALVPAAFDPESEEPADIDPPAVVAAIVCPADPEERELAGAVVTEPEPLDRASERVELPELAAVVGSVLDETEPAKELEASIVPGFDEGAETVGPAGVVSPGPVGPGGAAGAVGLGVTLD